MTIHIAENNQLVNMHIFVWKSAKIVMQWKFQTSTTRAYFLYETPINKKPIQLGYTKQRAPPSWACASWMRIWVTSGKWALVFWPITKKFWSFDWWAILDMTGWNSCKSSKFSINLDFWETVIQSKLHVRKLEVLNLEFNEIFWTFTTSERLWTNFEPFLCQKCRIYTIVGNSHRKSIVNLANGQKKLVKSSWWILIDYMYCVLAIKKVQKTVMNDVWKCLSLVPFNQFLRKKDENKFLMIDMKLYCMFYL